MCGCSCGVILRLLILVAPPALVGAGAGKAQRSFGGCYKSDFKSTTTFSYLRGQGFPMPEGEGGDVLSCMLRHSHSQHGEDVLLLPTLSYITGGRPGVFVEIGANDGMYMSNTIGLERCLNWTGLLIEANPTTFKTLRYHYHKGCRSAQIVNSGACEGKGNIHMTRWGGVTSRDVNEMSPEFRARFDRRNGNKTVRVGCEPLGSLMDKAGIARANLLSLDVEGSEGKVLSTVDTARFDAILVESDGTNPEKEQRVHEMATRGGHIRANFSPLQPKQSRLYLRPKTQHSRAGKTRSRPLA